jgi:hypothetical protein
MANTHPEHLCQVIAEMHRVSRMASPSNFPRFPDLIHLKSSQEQIGYIPVDIGHDKDEHLALNLAEREKEFTPTEVLCKTLGDTFALLHFGKYNE